MSDTKIYKTYLYLAGIQVPFISASVSSQYGSLASLNIELNYSPYITHIHEYTKVQLWEQIIDNGQTLQPTLEFDGVVIGIVRSKNVLGQVSVRLTCLTDGVIWNQRKQYDFYLSQITQVDTRLTDTIQNVRSDGQIGNFIGETLRQNKFDIGCAVASVLTSGVYGEPQDSDQENTEVNIATVSYNYIYNGKKYKKQISTPKNQDKVKSITPDYYAKFLYKYKLATKLYGVSTSANVKEFFQHDRFIQMLENQSNDLVGENTFWAIAQNIMQYGFYTVYDIPNPTYISAKRYKEFDNVEGEDLPSDEENVAIPEKIASIKTSENNTNVDLATDFYGLAEYILKPVSVFGLPLKCNIIWPNQVISENLFYDMINTPTRILMQQAGVPGDDGQNILLTTKKIAGPYITNPEGFFKSFTPPVKDDTEKEKYRKIRPGEIYSDYEKEYGMRYTQMHMSYAFEETLLHGLDNDSNSEQTGEVAKKINNFLNYEYAQRFFAARNYSIQVTPDVDIVPGLPVIVLNNYKEHIICFCNGKQKTWNNLGNKSVALSVTHPRYYYEDIDKLGNIVDPTCTEELALIELETLFGSKTLIRSSENNKKPATRINSKQLKAAIDELFENYNKSDNFDYASYKREVCSYRDYIMCYTGREVEHINIMPDSYLEVLFESSKEANELSSHEYYVDGEKSTIIDNQDIILAHNEWIKEAQRI